MRARSRSSLLVCLVSAATALAWAVPLPASADGVRTVHRTRSGPTLPSEKPKYEYNYGSGSDKKPKKPLTGAGYDDLKDSEKERQYGGYCIYGLDGKLLHAPGGKRCPAKEGDPLPAAPAPQRPQQGGKKLTGGCAAGDCRGGQGTYQWSDGSRYVGGFEGGRPHGQGTLIRGDGSSYTGEWQNGKRTGQGTEMYTDGSVKSGLWEANRFIGERGGASGKVDWPDLSRPAARVGGGKRDAALVIGIERYSSVASIPLAADNATAWYDYLVKSRGVPVENARLMLDDDATVEEVRRAAKAAADQVGRKGTLWFVFIGHGAPARDGRDGLLVGFDAQQKARSLENRSLPQSELIDVLEESGAGRINVVLDACFSGRAGNGEQLVAGLQPLVVSSTQASNDPRTTVLTAARSNEYAGPLPGGARPAFSYLALGGLRGWADRNEDGTVTAGELHRYVVGAMQALVHDRRQRPTLVGQRKAAMVRSSGEKGPDLAGMVVGASRQARR